MHYVSLIIEFLRGRPVFVFWAVALAQAVLWTAVPAIFYSAPPGDVALLLAVGHEFLLGTRLGPPLAFWFGEAAFNTFGMTGVYALSQACILVAYWAVFSLGRRIVGTRHAVLGILLMVGIVSLTVPTPAFGPAVLAAPFWAMALLHYWRAVGEGARGYWFVLAVDLGLLMLTNYIGVILVVLMVVFAVATSRGRRSLTTIEPYLAVALFAIVLLPHAAWIGHARDVFIAGLSDNPPSGRLSPGEWLVGAFVLAHLGLGLMVALASGYPRKRREQAPEITRDPVHTFARAYVYLFAFVPALAAVTLAFGLDRLGPLTSLAPLVLLSGLAVILLAGDVVPLYRERLVSLSWLGFLLVPPILVVLGLTVLPWIVSVDLKIAQPAKAQAQFFAESFERRTGKRLAYVTGDARLALLIGLYAPGRPKVYFAWAPELSPWVTASDVVANGGLLVWPATDNAGTPPASLREQFPAMTYETPRVFARMVQGTLPAIRVGWSVLRPPQ